MHSFIRSFVHTFVRSFILPFIHALLPFFLPSLTVWFVCSNVHSSVRRLIRSFLRSFIRAFNRSCIHPFFLSFIDSRTPTNPAAVKALRTRMESEMQVGRRDGDSVSLVHDQEPRPILGSSSYPTQQAFSLEL